MKILVVTQYFWPEYFRVNDLILGVKEKGHEVTVFTGKPNYPSGKFFTGYSFFGKSLETWNGITIHRSPLIPRGNGNGFRLGINYLSFVFFGCLKALFLSIQVDRILVYQMSPVTMALPAIIFKRKTKAPLFLYVQDLWPESIVAAGGIKSKFLINRIEQLTKWIYKQSDRILIQSRSFAPYLIAKGVDSQKIDYLPNSTDPFYQPVEKNNELKKYFPGRLNIVFAGNIGEAQSFPTIIAAAKKLKSIDNSICWIIIGEGRKKTELMGISEKEGLQDVLIFTGAFEALRMPAFFAHADALLISLKKELIFSLTIPNKLQSYMACGRPIIGSLDGEGAAVITDADGGLVSAAEDAEGLAQNVLAFSKMPRDEKERLAHNAYNYFQEEFNRNLLLDRLISIID